MDDTDMPGGQGAAVGGKEPDAATSRSVHRHRSRHRRHRSSRSLLPVIGLTALGGLALIGLMLYLFGTIARYSSESNLQRIELNAKETELRDLRAELKRVRGELDAMVGQRMPRLEPLEYDKVIPVNQGHVRNILFTRTHAGDKTEYEYKIVVENNGSVPVVPVIRVLLFDRTGIQVGGATVEGVPLMREGDSESFTAEMELFLDAVPEYFHVDSKAD